MKPSNLWRTFKQMYLTDLPSYVIFFVTARCNSKCIFCFYHQQLNAADNELSMDEIERIADGFEHLPYLLLSGGEPFMRSDIDQICLAFNHRANTRFISIPTNGILSDTIAAKAENLLTRGRDLFLRIALSIDNIQDKHDKLRGVPGNYQKVMETYRRLDELRKRYKNLNIDAAIAFNHWNQDEIHLIYQHLRDNYAFNNISVGFIREGGPTPEAQDVDINKYEAVNLRIIDDKQGTDNRPLFPVFRAVNQLSLENMIRTLRDGRIILPCIAASKMLVINETGEVFPCEVLWERKLGDLRESNYSIKTILNSEQAKRQRRFIVNSRCFCAWECAQNANIFFNIAYPYVAGKILAKSIKNLIKTNRNRPNGEQP